MTLFCQVSLPFLAQCVPKISSISHILSAAWISKRKILPIILATASRSHQAHLWIVKVADKNLVAPFLRGIKWDLLLCVSKLHMVTQLRLVWAQRLKSEIELAAFLSKILVTILPHLSLTDFTSILCTLQATILECSETFFPGLWCRASSFHHCVFALQSTSCWNL